MRPSILPGGRGVLFTIRRNAQQDGRLAVYDPKSGQHKTLLHGGVTAAEYIDTGHLVYAMSGTLFAVGFGLDRLEVLGDPVRISDLEIDTFANYAVSRNGTLAYVTASASPRVLVWVDRQGRETPIAALEPRQYQTLGLSPDGERVALTVADQEGTDIWIWDLTREKATRLTFDPLSDELPRWTPDGRRIVFRSNRAGAYNLYHQPFDESGAVERLTTSDNDQYPNSVTQDGTVLGCELRSNTGYDIVRFPAVPASQGSGRTPTRNEDRSQVSLLVSTPGAEWGANISPDGRYVAFQSQESGGRFEIYVRPYPDVNRNVWQISTDGGLAPVWARKGGELFYLDTSNTLMAVPVQTSGPSFGYDKPARVFDTKYSGDFYSYDVHPDGRRFLMMKDSAAGDRAPASIVVVLNWNQELKRLVPRR